MAAARRGYPVAVASSTPAMLRVSAPLIRAAAGAVPGSALRTAANSALRWIDAGGPALRGHQLAPAALRIERASSRHRAGRSKHTAVTIWFGEGPRLPAPGGGDRLRSAARIGSGVLGAAALAAMTVVAARREQERRVIDAADEVVSTV